MISRIIKQITTIGLVTILLGCQDNRKNNYKYNSRDLRHQDNFEDIPYFYIDRGHLYSKEMEKFYVHNRKNNCWRPVPIEENREIIIWHEDGDGDGKLDCVIDLSKIQS